MYCSTMNWFAFHIIYVFLLFTRWSFAAVDDDEGRPYEFGFTIENYQHRHEKKDVNGIIQGEFGFITADGIYHVTVYATDENGDFHILSMKNIRVSPPLDQLDRSKSLGQLKTNVGQHVTTTSRSIGPFTTQATIKPACGGCGYVTTPKNQEKFKFQSSAFQKPGNTFNTNSNTPAPKTYNNGHQAKEFTNPSVQRNHNSHNVPAIGVHNPSFGVNLAPGLFNNVRSGNLLPPVTETNNLIYNPGISKYEPKEITDLKLQGRNNINPSTDTNTYTHRDAKKIENAQNDRLHTRVSVSNNAIHVPGNPDIPIVDKYPNMVDGLPADIEEKDIKDILYKFNYTVGFHGHYERGLKSGAKIGGYFVNGRDGISRIVTYVADENGYRPKFKFVNLGLDSPLTPHEDTEKKFGLKSFEFIWYPIN